MKTLRTLKQGAIAALVLTLTAIGIGVFSPAIGQISSPVPVMIRGQRVQETLRVNPVVSPNRTEFGCESEALGGTIVNGIRVTGAAAGSGPLIAGLPCTGGDTNQILNLQGAGSSGVAFPNGVSGSLNATTTNFVTLSAVDHCSTFTAATAAIKTRTATGDWAYSRTAGAAETHFFKCSIPLTALRTTASKGIRLDSFSLAYTIATVAVTTFNPPTLQTTVYANNVATAVATYGTGITFTGATATQANPYLTAATITTPAYMNTNNADLSMEFSVVLANTGVFTFRALVLNYTLGVL